MYVFKIIHVSLSQIVHSAVYSPISIFSTADSQQTCNHGIKAATEQRTEINATKPIDNNNKAKGRINNNNNEIHTGNLVDQESGNGGRRKKGKSAKIELNNGLDTTAQPSTAIHSSISNATATTTGTNKVNKTAEMLQTIPTAVVDNNLDSVLKTVTQMDNTCDFLRCRVKTSLIGQDCRLCKQRFCMKHQLPEVHGCGGAIKRTERAEFTRPRQSLPISAALRRNEHKDAHTRLEQKLKEMSLARQKMRK